MSHIDHPTVGGLAGVYVFYDAGSREHPGRMVVWLSLN